MSLDLPYSFGIDLDAAKLRHEANHIQRRLSSMRGQYFDQVAYGARLAQDDALLYEVYEVKRPHVAGEVLHGLSVLYPGKVGDEYHMTKGHFHNVLETGEVYYCLKGRGLLVMETPEGDWAVEELRAGRVTYVPPRWAHRSVNIDAQDPLITFFIYPGNAGHDYGTIEQFGFRKMVIDHAGLPAITDNPRWKAPAERKSE